MIITVYVITIMTVYVTTIMTVYVIMLIAVHVYVIADTLACLLLQVIMKIWMQRT